MFAAIDWFIAADSCGYTSTFFTTLHPSVQFTILYLKKKRTAIILLANITDTYYIYTYEIKEPEI